MFLILKFFTANKFINLRPTIYRSKIYKLIKIFAMNNFKINNHQVVSRAFNILHYNN